MANSGNEKLKIKTVSGEQGEDNITFSPEEMQPFEVAEALESDLISGKTEKQVRRAKRLFGVNDTRGEFRLSFRESLRNQLKGMTPLFLMICSLVMYLFRTDEPTYLIISIVIAAITVFNALAENRASVALRVPKKYSSLKAKVIRNGEELSIDSRQLVPGDIIFIEEGVMVPADCRLIDDMGLSVMETHVSGNPESVVKNSRYVARDGSEPICANMVYAGSIVTAGHASAVVCRIGKETLIRKIRSGSENYTPDIIKFVQNLCRYTSVASVIICFLLLFIGVAAGADITRWFICALAIGAASLCDSMVSLCASSLGFGAKKMTDDGMVIKNYGCVQTLARVNTIMCGKSLAFPPKRISLTGLYFSGRSYDREKRPDETAEELLKLMLVCSDARKITAAEKKKTRGLPEYKGLPLDDAIVDYFGEWNKTIGEIRDQYIRMDTEYSLSGEVSRMLALHNGKNTVIVRGSPENILSRCAGYSLDGTDYKLSDFTRKKILSAAEDFARTNSFLVAVACGETSAETLRDIAAEERLIFKGFVSFASSLDAGVASSVYRCESAGIETVLNSNDAYYTALNSAKSAGIITDESQLITAEQYRSISEGLRIANCPYYRLFLNIDDGEWLDIIKMRRDRNRVTAVTAERINELPIMSEADVSIVPESSCDTLRQTADAMLLGSGINLIADGILNAKTICRRIFSVVSYLPAGILMMFIASVFCACYDQSPALRAQDVLFGGIIFNLAFAFALAFEPRHIKNLRDCFAFNGTKPRLNDFIYPLMFSTGGGITLFIVSASTQNYTCALAALTIMLFFHAATVAGKGGVIATKRFGNRLLWLCSFAAAAITAILVFTGFGRNIFGYGLPGISKLIITLSFSVGYCVLSQILRYFVSTKGKKPAEPSAEEEENDLAERDPENSSFNDLFGDEEDTSEDEEADLQEDPESAEAELQIEPEEYENEKNENNNTETHERSNEDD